MLRTRLYLGLLPLLLLFIVVGGAAMFICGDLGNSIGAKLIASYRVMIGVHEMREAAYAMTTAIHEAQNGRMLEARPAFEGQRSRFRKTLMDQSFKAAGTARTQDLAKVADAFDRLAQYGDAMFQEGAAVSRWSYNRVETALNNTLNQLEELTQADYRELHAEAQRVADISRVSINVVAGSMVGGILLSLFLSYRLSRSLLRPIRALTASAASLGDGNLDNDVPVTSKDELGELARTFNTMAAKLRAYRDATAEKVVRAQRTMEATLTSTPDPLFVVSRDGTPELRNPAAEELARTIEFAEGFPENLRQRIDEVLASGTHYLPTGYDQVVTAHVGRDERHYLPRILAIGDALTGFGGAAMILQDVTKFRLLDDAKSNLVGTVSHELKTPLTSLRMAVYLLLEQNVGQLTPKQRDLLETARDDADRLLRILNDILDLSRFESGVSALNRREVPVTTLLDDVAREMKAITEAADQKIDIRISPGLSVINVDPERLRHVFINLLANASKYSPPDSVITLYAQPSGDGVVRFGVRDRGPGIPEESLPHIFEKFYRVPGQTRKGAGLGLTIAREIVLAHGGAIACNSKVGEGSDFYFLLPLAPVSVELAVST
jgi:two-component system, NtrC family, sensor histidine kinase KinB